MALERGMVPHETKSYASERRLSVEMNTEDIVNPAVVGTASITLRAP